MIVGMGTDIVAIERISKVCQQFPTRFVNKILNSLERLAYLEHNQPIFFLAKRFAIKEAAAKALGTGFRAGIGWHHIHIQHNDLGSPILTFEALAKDRYESLGGTHTWVSVSDEKAYVVATVILEREI